MQRIAAALGEEAVEEHPARELDGLAVAATLRPADGEAVARALEAVGACGLAAVVKGGGNRLGIGNLPNREALFLATERLSGVDEFEPAEGVCHARAGTRLAAADAIVRPHGWEIPFDAPGETATVGGVIAAAAVGPRAHGHGRPRDLVLGLEVALASGQRTHCGGRVVKNVTGYDLNKLYTGSFGSLGVIEGAWLRLRPLPERTAVFEASASRLEGVGARGLAAARRATARAVAIAVSVRGAECDVRFAIELAGDAPSVERDAAWIEEHCDARAAEAGAVDRMRALQGRDAEAFGLRFRIDALSSRLEPVLAQLCGRCTSVLVYPGLGLLFADLRLDRADAGQVDSAFRFAARSARAGGGSFVCESAPAWAKQGRDVFGAAASALPLIESLKQRFDPGRILNPGRFAGGI
ncbi:MAG: FAD-binding oxidoreductase [Myxococcales bacterium]|nr:FAD-binding oxidoreductase [Myxococcales bacterium]